MSRTTGPILAMGAITLGNKTLIANQPLDWRIPVATGIAAGLMAVFEKAWPDGAVGFTWLAFVSLLFTRTDPKVPAPAESFVKWWNAGGNK